MHGNMWDESQNIPPRQLYGLGWSVLAEKDSLSEKAKPGRRSYEYDIKICKLWPLGQGLENDKQTNYAALEWKM